MEINMQNHESEGKILNFFELLQKHNIEIPIIQRDYAQGRIENSDILNKFLLALKNSIITKTEIKLDFIYGDIVNENFQPLDGQQRLTTLFLLHWYAARKYKKDDKSIIELLLRFSYETRISSREFCNALVNHIFNIPTIEKEISDTIIDSNWFVLSWKKDPTIQSMLNTIDCIHRHFYEINDLWHKLTSEKLISFYYVELKNMGLTDDLYIKMNARGRLLTPFENFKAGLQKVATEKKWNEGVDFQEGFSLKIDNIWTDYFWENFRKNNSIDSAHMRFITTVAMNIYKDIVTDDKLVFIQKSNDNSTYIAPSHFAKKFYDYLYKCYEIYSGLKGKEDNLKLEFPLWRHQPKKSILSDIVYEESGSSYTLKVLFHAQTEYLMRVSDFDKNAFSEWMRVIRNIISRGDATSSGERPDIIRSPQTFQGVVALVSELASGCNSIYEYLCNETIKSIFAQDQVKEEQVKARLIKKNPQLKELIWKVEDNELLRGRINFVLHCIDHNNGDAINEKLLSEIQIIFEKYFNKEEVPKGLRQAMLTINVNDKYEFYHYWWSSWDVIKATKRKFFPNYRELEYYIYSEYKEYFKKLILLLTKKDFQQIINEFSPPSTMPNWKTRLIKEKDLFNNRKTEYIAIPDDNSYCYLLKGQRPRDIDGSIKIE